MDKPVTPWAGGNCAPAAPRLGLHQRTYRFCAPRPADADLARAMLAWACERWQAVRDADRTCVEFTLRIGLLSTGELLYLLAQVAAGRLASTLQVVHGWGLSPAAESAMRPTRGVRRRAIAGLKRYMIDAPAAERPHAVDAMGRLGLDEFPELQGP